jgi:hypothetical protein
VKCAACGQERDGGPAALCSRCAAEVAAAESAAGRPPRRARLYLGKFWDRLKPGQTLKEKYYGVKGPDDPYCEHPEPLKGLSPDIIVTRIP